MSTSRDEAEDLAQEVLLQILKSAPRYRADGCLEAWADVICVRTIMRQSKRRRKRHEILTEWCEPRIEGATEKDFLHRVRVERLMSILGRMSEYSSLVLVLKLVYDYTLEEVAQITNQPVETVRNILRGGRAKLRKLARKDKILKELYLEGSQ